MVGPEMRVVQNKTVLVEVIRKSYTDVVCGLPDDLEIVVRDGKEYVGAIGPLSLRDQRLTTEALLTPVDALEQGFICPTTGKGQRTVVARLTTILHFQEICDVPKTHWLVFDSGEPYLLKKQKAKELPPTVTPYVSTLDAFSDDPKIVAAEARKADRAQKKLIDMHKALYLGLIHPRQKHGF